MFVMALAVWHQEFVPTRDETVRGLFNSVAPGRAFRPGPGETLTVGLSAVRRT